MKETHKTQFTKWVEERHFSFETRSTNSESACCRLPLPLPIWRIDTNAKCATKLQVCIRCVVFDIWCAQMRKAVDTHHHGIWLHSQGYPSICIGFVLFCFVAVEIWYNSWLVKQAPLSRKCLFGLSVVNSERRLWDCENDTLKNIARSLQVSN